MMKSFLWIKNQPHTRLTIIDPKFKIIIADVIIPREYFTSEYIKQFLKTSLLGLDAHTLVTDGFKSYPEIIKELELKQQRCTFHVMKNLIDDLNPIHSRLKRKIKKAKEKIPELEKELEELQAKYKGKKVEYLKKTKKDKKAMKK